MGKYFIAIFLLGVSAVAGGQSFGGNPPSIKWKQINTDTARIIFPDGMEQSAERVGEVIHHLQKNHTSLGNKFKKVNIVLQNQTTLSNAYVQLGPYRSEFYMMAPQNSFNLGALNWAENLALHEYRHVEQYSNFNVGLSKLMSVIFGQEGQALANGIAVPDWFFEGDAVFTETSLSTQGRGRLPDFFNGYRSLYFDGKNFSFMKLRNGSLKDYVPNHYEIGYLLTAYGNEKYGSEFWKKVTNDAAAFKPLIYPMQGAVKKYSGVPYKKFVNDAFDFYQKKWEKKETSIDHFISKESSYQSNYKYPYVTEDGFIIALKRSQRQVPLFVELDTLGNEMKIATRGIAYDDYFSYRNGKIVYAAYAPDARWGYREYSNIVVLDISGEVRETTDIHPNLRKLGKRTINPKEKIITQSEKYFSPDISPDGELIVVVDMKPTQESSIKVINLQGEIKYRSATQRGHVYTYPKFSADGKSLYVAARNGLGQMALKKIALESNKVTDILPFDERIIGFPTVQGDTVFFSATNKETDEIWAYVESTKMVYRVASGSNSFYQAAILPGTSKLVTSTFTSGGYRLAAIDKSKQLWQKVDVKENRLADLYVPGALQQENSNTLRSIPDRKFEVKKYSKLTHPFNFHSWRPYYDNPEYSFTVFGQNVLNTLQSELSYTYNQNEGSHKVDATGIYGAWYIQPTVSISQTYDRSVFYNADTTFRYNEFKAGLGARLPLNLSGGKQYRFLTINSSVNNQQLNWTGIGKNLLRGRNFNFYQGSISYSGQIQKAPQHIFPRLAQTLLVQYRSAITDITANQLLVNGALYLPGLHVNHNIVFTASYHARDTMNQYYFSNNFPFSRGYTAIDFPRMWKFGANYHLPLLYPDWGFANIVYFKRIRANAFYDYTETKSLRTGNHFYFSTAGVEIYFDTKWWNQQEVSFGIRYSRLLDREFRGPTQPNQWEIILPVNLF